MLPLSTLVLLVLAPLCLVRADASCYDGATVAPHAHCYGVMINMNFDGTILDKRRLEAGDLLGQLFSIVNTICHLQNATQNPTPLLGAVVGRYKLTK